VLLTYEINSFSSLRYDALTYKGQQLQFSKIGVGLTSKENGVWIVVRIGGGGGDIDDVGNYFSVCLTACLPACLPVCPFFFCP
jgi:hypothetical protein